MSITNKEELKVFIHGIHDDIRNSGAGYGMDALKIFYLFYGLRLIDKDDLLKELNLSDKCSFKNILIFNFCFIWYNTIFIVKY